MPTDYQCEACKLAIQIGWFHYHSAPDDYWCAQLGFCRKCGTIHKLEIPPDGTFPERIFTQPGPLQVAESGIQGIPYRIPLQDWKVVGDRQFCGHCGELGGVLFGSLKETPLVAICPRCGSSPMKRLHSWMT